MIKLSELNSSQGRIVRETTAPILIVEKGEERTETIRVRYYSLSIKEGKEYRKKLEEGGGESYWSDLLFPIVAGLPDIVDGKGKPVKVTLDVLESLNSLNLQAIHKAIQEDLRPK